MIDFSKYNLCPLEEFPFSALYYYETFLKQTDYITNKIVETQFTGVSISDYTEVMEYRQYCRDQINLLRGE